MVGQRLRFRHPVSGEDLKGVGHVAGKAGVTVMDDDGHAHRVEHGGYRLHHPVDDAPKATPADELDFDGGEAQAQQERDDAAHEETGAAIPGLDEHSGDHMRLGPRSRLGKIATASRVYRAAGLGSDGAVKRSDVSVHDKGVSVHGHPVEDGHVAAMVKHYHGQGENDDDDLFDGVTGADVDKYVRGHVKSGLEGLSTYRKRLKQ